MMYMPDCLRATVQLLEVHLRSSTESRIRYIPSSIAITPPIDSYDRYYLSLLSQNFIFVISSPIDPDTRYLISLINANDGYYSSQRFS